MTGIRQLKYTVIAHEVEQTPDLYFKGWESRRILQEMANEYFTSLCGGEFTTASDPLAALGSLIGAQITKAGGNGAVDDGSDAAGECDDLVGEDEFAGEPGDPVVHGRKRWVGFYAGLLDR